MASPTERTTYSDLEAIDTSIHSTTRRPSYWNEKFIADDQPNAANAPEPMSSSDLSPVDSLPPPPPAPAAAYYLVDSKGQAQALYTVPTSATSDRSSIYKPDFFPSQLPPPPPPPPPRGSNWWHSLGQGRRICGVRKNIFLAVFGVICALVFGALVAVLIVTHTGDSSTNRNNSPGSSDSSPPAFSRAALLANPPANVSAPLLPASDLAALNWTDTTTGDAYTALVFQSPDLTLRLAARNERTNARTVLALPATANASPGTPLAAASNNGLWNVFYTTTANVVAELWTTSPLDAASWAAGWTSPSQLAPGSGVGAMWQLCSECDNALFVVYQEKTAGSLVWSEMVNLTWSEEVVLALDAVPGGGPAVVSAFTDVGPKVRTGSDKNAVRVYYAEKQGGALKELLKGPLGGGQITEGNFRKPLTGNFSMNPSPRLASLTYGEPLVGWDSNLLSLIDPASGNLTSVNWVTSRGSWVVQAPQLLGAPEGLEAAGFSAVAQTQEMRIYLLSPARGEIHQFRTNLTDPFVWNWDDVVQLATV